RASCGSTAARNAAVFEKTTARPRISVAAMFKISNTQLWVHDQDTALAFYTDKLGWEVRADVTLAEMGDFRWLTVGPAGQEDLAIVLMAIPGAPMIDADTREQIEG